MRTFVAVGLCLALALGCDDDKPSGPAARATAPVDALWKMAPEGTTGAIVVSPYGFEMLDGGIAALRAFFVKGGDELAPLAIQLDGLLGDLGPFKDFSLNTLALTPSKGGALFFAKAGLVAVLSIKNRDAFVANRKGTRATTPDGVDKLGDKVACKQIAAHYVCASNEAQLATIGKSAIGERMAKLGSRGDVEVIATELPLQGLDQPRSSLVAAFTLERGSWLVRGLLGNPPDSVTAKLAAPSKPRTTVGKSAGFAVFDIRQVLDTTEDKIVEGVTEADVVKSISGPMTVEIPAGSRVLDMQMPLSNPKPLQDVLASCTKVRSFAALGAEIVDGVCRIKAPQAGLELDLWVADNVFHVGKKGAKVVGDAVPMPPPAVELANGMWAMTFWGRGTMLARQATDDVHSVDGIDPAAPTQNRVLSMLNEVGFGVKKDGDSLRFIAMMRTAFANPQPIVDKLTSVTGMEVLSNSASAKGSMIALAHPGSPFAGDFAAGQHGMLIPTQMLDTALQIIIPALVRYTRGGGPTEAPQEPQAPPPPGVMTTQLAQAYATKGYEIWKQKNPTQPCPPSITHLGASVGPAIPTKDEWGHDFVVKCGKDLPAGAKDIAIISAGPDGKLGTADDIKSY